MTCPWCTGQLTTETFEVHLASCPSAPPKPIRTKNDMLGSSFRLPEQEGNMMGYSPPSAVQPIVDIIAQTIRTDEEFKTMFLKAAVARVDRIADQVADTIAKSALYTDTSYSRTQGTRIADWAKDAINACLSEAFQPAVAAHVQERLTTMYLSQVGVSVVAQGEAEMNGPCDFHNHPPYADVVEAAEIFRAALDAGIMSEGNLARARRILERASCPAG